MADERAKRFRYLLSEIEVRARKILDGDCEADVLGSLAVMALHLGEATAIFGEVSREALDKVTG
jgi:hypothetical protein